MSRKLAVVVGTTFVAAFSPTVAQAANVSAVEPAAGSPRVLSYTALAGETNQPTFTREGANVVVRDPSARRRARARRARTTP
jgi:hypothetical protein